MRKHECTPTPAYVYGNKVIINAHGLKNASSLLVPLVVQRSGTQDGNCLRKSRGSLWELGLLLEWAQGPRPKAKSLGGSLRQLLCSFLSIAVGADAEGRWKWRLVILVLAWSLPFKWASQTSTVTFLCVDFCWKGFWGKGMQRRTSRKKKACHCGFIWVKREGTAEGREGGSEWSTGSISRGDHSRTLSCAWKGCVAELGFQQGFLKQVDQTTVSPCSSSLLLPSSGALVLTTHPFSHCAFQGELPMIAREVR